MRDFKELINKIKEKKAKVGIIGLGYVGLPLALLFAKKGFLTTGFVRNQKKAADLNNGINHLADKDINTNLKSVLQKKQFTAKVINEDDLQKQDVIIICVPTPVDHSKKPDITDLKTVAQKLSLIDVSGKLIINESTVAPFTTREILGNIGGNYFLVCSPERIDPGNKLKTTENIPKVIGGKDRESLLLGEAIYKKILDQKIVKVKSLEAAEMAKMLENTYRAVNIALISEFSKLAEKCDIDILDVIEAASTKWSFQPHYPGIGVGGHCIPVDPYYVLELAKKKNLEMKIVEEGLGEIEKMPNDLLKKLLTIYKKGMSILVYGLTYKKDVDDVRESPAIIFSELLKNEKINFDAYDPILGEEKVKKAGFKYKEKGIVDIFVVATDHSQLNKDYLRFIDENTVIIDGRNFFKFKVGKKVLGVGRSLV